MSKIHLDRLKKRHGYSGEPYRQLVTKIIANNSQAIRSRVANLAKSDWEAALSKVGKREAQIVIPDQAAVIPKRDFAVRKAAEKGDLISDTLRDRLTKALKDTMRDFEAGGETAYIRRGGKYKGTLNPKLVAKFEAKTREVFASYTKVDPRVGVPGNCHTIAVTETRAVANETKKAFARKMLEDNPGRLRMFKQWRQNRGLSKAYRDNHAAVDGMKVDFDKPFRVPRIGRGGKMLKSTDAMDHPHDPAAPAGQVIGCNCDLLITAQTIDDKPRKR